MTRMTEYDEKMERLAEKMETQKREQMTADYPNYPKNCLDQDCAAIIRPGKKWDKIDLGQSGKLMVDRDTGEIFGIKGYGVVHKGHPFGTLDTIADWYWGDYKPRRIGQG